MIRKVSAIGIVWAMLLIMPAPGAVADFVNGGFETGDFTGWTEFNGTDTFIVTAAYGSGPTEGTYEALIQTPPDELTNVIGLAAFVGADFFDLLFGSGNNLTIEGSAIKQTFYAHAGQEICFDFNFLTNRTRIENWFNLDDDFGFAVIGGSLDNIGSALDASTVSATAYTNETGWDTWSYIIPTTGFYTLAVGVGDVIPANLGGNSDESAMLVDNFCMSVIPEPTSISLLGLGLGGMVLRRIRRRM